ncbi:MAG: hypothetical protein CL609_10765 [Anaerolineaceae bacterium]|nr:hypothetical protein [Anaerolineaceae bacterium]
MPIDEININYESLKKIADLFLREGELMQQLRANLSQHTETIAGINFQGKAANAFIAEIQTTVLPSLDRLSEGLFYGEESLNQIIQIFQDAENEAANLFSQATDQNNQSGGLVEIGINEDGEEVLILETPGGNSEYILLNGKMREHYLGYLSGELTWDELTEFIEDDPFKKEYFKSTLTLWKSEEFNAYAAVRDGTYSGNWGEFSGRLLSAEIKSSAKADIDLSKFKAVAEAEGKAGAYLVHGTYNKELGSLAAAVDGYIGAQVSGNAGIFGNLEEQRVGIGLGGEAFVGAKAEGELEWKVIDTDWIDITPSVNGALSAGAGAVLDVDIGFNNGSFKVEYEVGAALGLGAQAGGGLEIDISELLKKFTQSDTNHGGSGW